MATVHVQVPISNNCSYGTNVERSWMKISRPIEFNKVKCYMDHTSRYLKTQFSKYKQNIIKLCRQGYKIVSEENGHAVLFEEKHNHSKALLLGFSKHKPNLNQCNPIESSNRRCRYELHITSVKKFHNSKPV